jgi:LPXTG-motif cell wall-anchored protein
MKNSLKLSMLAFALVLLMSPAAHAQEGRGKLPVPTPSKVAPEVDPSLAFGGLTLLGGTLTVLRSRRRK